MCHPVTDCLCVSSEDEVLVAQDWCMSEPGVWTAVVGRSHWSSKYLCQDHSNSSCPRPQHPLNQIPHWDALALRGTGGTKSFSLRTACPPSHTFISNYFPAWLHKKNVSNVQTALFSCLGGPDIITAITNPGLHPSPLLPLARGSSRGTQSTGRVSVGPGHQGRPPPCSLHCLAWGMATVGACQSPGCPEGTEGGQGRLFLSRESGGLGPNFEKSPTPPPCLPAPASCLPPGHSGQQDREQDRRIKQQLQICRWYYFNGRKQEELKRLLMRVKEESKKSGLKHNI